MENELLPFETHSIEDTKICVFGEETMTYINELCADIGTDNCPCPLAETGDCLVCSRLAGRGECDCRWAGVCVYNEYIQNGGAVLQRREDRPVEILKKTWYGSDLLVLVLKVSKGFALRASRPGSFVFVNPVGRSAVSNVPVSIMRTDAEEGKIFLAIKIISAKTKAVAEAEDMLMLRGVYRNGLLGGGLPGLRDDVRSVRAGGSASGQGKPQERRWLVMTKGAGFAPAVNLLTAADGKVRTDLLIDTEKIGEEMISDNLRTVKGMDDGMVKAGAVSLLEMTEVLKAERAKGRYPSPPGIDKVEAYDRVMILASDYYIKTLAECLEIPSRKLVFCNNFRMCCGEGICGACGHTDRTGHVSKMCKCRNVDVGELLGV